MSMTIPCLAVMSSNNFIKNVFAKQYLILTYLANAGTISLRYSRHNKVREINQD